MKKKKTILMVLLLVSLLAFCSCWGPEATYKSAQNLLSKGKYTEAAKQFENLGGYEDAATLAIYCKACALCEAGNFDSGIAALENLGDYKDCKMRITYYTARDCENVVLSGEYEWLTYVKSLYQSIPLFLDSTNRADNLESSVYSLAEKLMNKGEWQEALSAFSVLSGEFEIEEKVEACWYGIAEEHLNQGQWDEAVQAFVLAGNHRDAATRILESYYLQGEALIETNEYVAAITAFQKASSYKDAEKRWKALLPGDNTSLIRNIDGHYVELGNVDTPMGYIAVDNEEIALADSNETYFYFESTEENAVSNVYIAGVAEKTGMDMLSNLIAIPGLYLYSSEIKSQKISGYETNYIFTQCINNQNDSFYATLTMYVDTVYNSSIVICCNSQDKSNQENLPSETDMLACLSPVFDALEIP